jgi:hypothetical protein
MMLGLAVLSGCTSVALVPPQPGDRISTAWGSQTTAGMTISPIPTAAAGGNGEH